MQNFFFGKCLFAYEIRFALEKKTKKIFWGKFSKFLCRMWKLYSKHFFQKNFKSVFFVTSLLNCSQKAAETV